ncbi:SdpI family protein [Chitinophaga sp. Ak27]|uniref:SdpI family protein n=1 Tax=Chitinophaga sp. Ak27 TaxID=2726116 RepID=UPI00145E33B6|nr:SdpI family protein [Chitinophaga sp. Ak27]NLU95931.1 SdpI family protein [Chitinophaga sp. Ak27]
MKENKWLRDVPLLAVMGAPFVAYLCLRSQLPPTLPSHYTIGAEGKWIANAYMSPLRSICAMLIGSLIVYAAMSIPTFINTQKREAPRQIRAIAPTLYIMKVALVLLFTGIPIYEMLVGAGKLSAGSSSMLAYMGGAGLLVLLNIFIYRVYAIMYKYADEKPLARKSYVVIWASTHVVTAIGPLCILLAGMHVNPERMIAQFVLVFLAITGNLLYNVRPNRYLGIRTPWTLRNDTVWRKTHRLGGILFFVFGTLGFIATLATTGYQSRYIMLAVLAITTLIPSIYSFALYRKLIHQA